MIGVDRLSRRIERREARIGVVGLGYAGLPLAAAFANAGFTVVGYDRDARRVRLLERGTSYVPDVGHEDLTRLVRSGRLATANEPGILEGADVAVLCVPTPLDGDGRPDTSLIGSAAATTAGCLHPGTLLVLESTSYPGTTEEIVGPALAARGLRSGRDVLLAFSSERVDPGNRDWGLEKIPKVVGGVNAESLALARLLYEQIVPCVTTVSSPAAAEMAKLVENVFREVNIALANELAQACDRLGLDVWEVIDAAATKPFGFMPFYPGPGRGGHCIPSDPVFLDWRLRQLGFRPELIETARRINDGMPGYTARRVAQLLEERGMPVQGARVLVLGVAYKPDVADVRDSPAIALMEELRSWGALVSYHDPHVPSLRLDGTLLHRRDLNEGLAEADCVVVVTDHSAYDWDGIAVGAACVLDCRGSTRGKATQNVVRL